MVEMYTATTIELDDIDGAVSEILSQLNIENNLKENSVGIITCHPEFIDSGILKELKEKLPVDLIGFSTLASATSEGHDVDALSITVLSSDDVYFATSKTDNIKLDTMKAQIINAYEEITSKLHEEPKLIMPFGPIIEDINGEMIANCLHDVVVDIPTFGSIAVASGYDSEKSFTIYDGEEYEKSLVLLGITGNINPKFKINIISDDKIQKQKAIITASEGSVLKEVNGMNLIEYMKTLGLSNGKEIEGSTAIPFIVDYSDGTKPVARGIYTVSDDGYAHCGGNMPEGGTLAIGKLDAEDVIKTAGELADEIAQENPDVAFLFPCQARNYVLETNYLAEMDIVKDKLASKVPYHLAYSGGEICPVYKENNKTVNRYHNFTHIVCTF